MHIEKRGRYQRLYSNRDVPSHTEMVNEMIYDLIMIRVELKLKMNSSVMELQSKEYKIICTLCKPRPCSFPSWSVHLASQEQQPQFSVAGAQSYLVLYLSAHFRSDCFR